MIVTKKMSPRFQMKTKSNPNFHKWFQEKNKYTIRNYLGMSSLVHFKKKDDISPLGGTTIFQTFIFNNFHTFQHFHDMLHHPALTHTEMVLPSLKAGVPLHERSVLINKQFNKRTSQVFPYFLSSANVVNHFQTRLMEIEKSLMKKTTFVNSLTYIQNKTENYQDNEFSHRPAFYDQINKSLNLKIHHSIFRTQLQDFVHHVYHQGNPNHNEFFSRSLYSNGMSFLTSFVNENSTMISSIFYKYASMKMFNFETRSFQKERLRFENVHFIQKSDHQFTQHEGILSVDRMEHLNKELSQWTDRLQSSPTFSNPFFHSIINKENVHLLQHFQSQFNRLSANDPKVNEGNTNHFHVPTLLYTKQISAIAQSAVKTINKLYEVKNAQWNKLIWRGNWRESFFLQISNITQAPANGKYSPFELKPAIKEQWKVSFVGERLRKNNLEFLREISLIRSVDEAPSHKMIVRQANEEYFLQPSNFLFRREEQNNHLFKQTFVLVKSLQQLVKEHFDKRYLERKTNNVSVHLSPLKQLSQVNVRSQSETLLLKQYVKNVFGINIFPEINRHVMLLKDILQKSHLLPHVGSQQINVEQSFLHKHFHQGEQKKLFDLINQSFLENSNYLTRFTPNYFTKNDVNNYAFNRTYDMNHWLSNSVKAEQNEKRFTEYTHSFSKRINLLFGIDIHRKREGSHLSFKNHTENLLYHSLPMTLNKTELQTKGNILELFNFIQQKSPTSQSGQMDADYYSIQWVFKTLLNKVRISSGYMKFLEGIYRASPIKSGRKYAKAHLIKHSSTFQREQNEHTFINNQYFSSMFHNNKQSILQLFNNFDKWKFLNTSADLKMWNSYFFKDSLSFMKVLEGISKHFNSVFLEDRKKIVFNKLGQNSPTFKVTKLENLFKNSHSKNMFNMSHVKQGIDNFLQTLKVSKELRHYLTVINFNRLFENDNLKNHLNQFKFSTIYETNFNRQEGTRAVNKQITINIAENFIRHEMMGQQRFNTQMYNILEQKINEIRLTTIDHVMNTKVDASDRGIHTNKLSKNLEMNQIVTLEKYTNMKDFYDSFMKATTLVNTSNSNTKLINTQSNFNINRAFQVHVNQTQVNREEMILRREGNSFDRNPVEMELYRPNLEDTQSNQNKNQKNENIKRIETETKKEVRQSPQHDINIDTIVDKVYTRIQRKLQMENQRRGLV